MKIKVLYGKSLREKIIREWNLIYSVFSLILREKDFVILGTILPSVIPFYTVIKCL